MHDFPARHDRFALVRDHALRDLIERLDQAQDNLSHLAGKSRSRRSRQILEDAHDAIAEAAGYLLELREGQS
jgi:hypothetical protein